jgi:hypothetical protein
MWSSESTTPAILTPARGTEARVRSRNKALLSRELAAEQLQWRRGLVQGPTLAGHQINNGKAPPDPRRERKDRRTQGVDAT